METWAGSFALSSGNLPQGLRRNNEELVSKMVRKKYSN